MSAAPDDNVVLLPNAMAINAHLYLLFDPAFVKDFPDAWIEIAYSHPSGGAIYAAEIFSAFDLKAASEFALAKNRAGFNIYVGPALRQGSPGKGGRATDANYLASRYAWVDVDEGYDATIGILRARGLRPAMVIRTGSIPEPRLQIYFQLAEKVSSLQLRTLNAALHVLFPVSDSVVSPSHVMRLNGTINYPTAGKTTRGRVPEVVGVDLATEDLWRHAPPYTHSWVYTERQLLEGVGILTVLEASQTATGDPWLDFAAEATGGRKGRSDDALSELLEASRVQGCWHNSIRDAIATMVGRGWEEAAIRLACAPYCQDGAGDRDLTPLIAGAFAKFGRTPPEGEEETPQTPQTPPGQAAPKAVIPDLYECFWHDDTEVLVSRSWLIDKLLPEKGTGLASGQWGTGKSYAALDLAACVMTGLPFAGYPVMRRGGVLFIAAEAASEVRPRLKALVTHKLRPAAIEANAAGRDVAAFGNLDALPFVWIEQAPNLQNPKDLKKLADTAKARAEELSAKYDLPLALIIIDTMSAVGHYKNADDAAEAQRVMSAVAELSRLTGAFVLVVDHFGKAVETGTRGSSAKEGAADAVLALVGDRDIGGTLINLTMSLRKSRGSRTGIETPFTLKEVTLEFNETACIVEWKKSREPDHAGEGSSGRKKGWWSKPLRILRAALEVALAEHSELVRPYAMDSTAILAVSANFVREEFLASYSVDDKVVPIKGGKESGAERKVDAKRKAYSRAVEDAQDLKLIGFRVVGANNYLWLIKTTD